MEHVMSYTLGQVSHRQPEAAAQRWLAVLKTWHERQAQRHALRQLDEHLLADIGLTGAEAEAEARKPFWVA